jgi:hypothetical protein
MSSAYHYTLYRCEGEHLTRIKSLYSFNTLLIAGKVF